MAAVKLPWANSSDAPPSPPWGKAAPPVDSARVIEVDQVTPNAPQGLADPSIELIDLFISEYVKDFNKKNAALRTEHQRPEFRGPYGSSLLEGTKILESPYGQWKIDQVMEGLDGKTPVKRRHIVRNLLTEGNDMANTSGDRQKALNSAADLQGQKIIKSQVDLTAIIPTINLTANKPKEIDEGS